MQLLIRSVGERFVIEGGITLEVISIHGHQVKFGIVAPKNVAVHRKEVYERIQAGVPHPRKMTA
ncbi:carbon storage regulator [Metapseudomonas otitidis]|jgi:carbon storage regulator|uniref:Carbon storage regulator n=1 Tax=Metapseudomonas otitidis TaxID=319939 RepID=A0A1I0UNF1_9GAMM|nr:MULTISPECIES: carbon storage regulator [Pseudomonas]MDL5597098.1 carbon storage regulator [Bacillus subtilis]KIV71024.1 hypothetical protein SZ55_2612 [Pseudomonas sp. FeS53a]MCO7557078.1 carbon storage regulator [Pseudomonas otitidis]MCP1616931.1 carbon storage regulator [Pseudomonas otitidis]MDG9780601.1 carbon storage regulator [Pseudomonas otitidis]